MEINGKEYTEVWDKCPGCVHNNELVIKETIDCKAEFTREDMQYSDYFMFYCPKYEGRKRG